MTRYLPKFCPTCKAPTTAHCDSPTCPWRKCVACGIIGGRYMAALRVRAWRLVRHDPHPEL